MLPEVSGPDAPRGRRGGWLAWPLLVLVALPMAVVLVVARRVLTGDTLLYGDLPGDLPLRERVALLLNVAGNDPQLLVPLVGLAALAWLGLPQGSRQPPRAALWCGAALAAVVALMAGAQCALAAYLFLAEPTPDSELGFFGPRESLLEIYGPRAAAALLLAALAAGLAGLLASTARAPAVPIGAPPEGEPSNPSALDVAPEEPEPGEQPEPVEPVDPDPHARYRKPS